MEQLIILIVTTLLAYALAPKPPKAKSPTIEDFQIPTAEDGRPIPVVFGTVMITGPNCVWYGDLDILTQTRDGVRTQRYYMGLQFGLCHGPVDALTKIEVGEREAWAGSQTVSGDIEIDEPGLFGGREKEGGIDGTLAVMMGESTQTANAYLTSVLGTPQPAYRGVLTCVFERGLVGANSPYLKPWAFKVRRILEGWHNDDPWYPETAEIAADLVPAPYDEYMDALGVDYWWKCEFSASGTTDVNVGTGADQGNHPLYKPSGTTLIEGQLAAVADGTYSSVVAGGRCLTAGDAHSVEFKAGNDSDLRAAILVQQPFVIGVWVDVDFADASVFQVFQTGYVADGWNYTGMEMHFNNLGSVGIQFGDGNGFAAANRRTYSADAGTIVEGRNLIIIACNASATAAGLLLQLWVNGVPITTTNTSGTATDIEWAAVGDLCFGRLNNASVAYNFVGKMDEPFIWFTSYGTFTDTDAAELWDAGTTAIDEPDAPLMNPAHIIYQCMTDPEWGMGIPTALINETDFEYAADIFYSECLGLCAQWLRQEPCDAFVQMVLDHCGAILRQDNETGQITIKVIRDDYTVGSLPTVDEEQIVALASWERAGYGELVSEVSVVYHDWTTNKDASTPPAHNLATIQAQQGIVAETTQYPMIPTASIASRVQMRDLRVKSMPLARGQLVVNRTAWSWLPGDVIVLSWAKLGLTSVVCRVVATSTGTLTDGAIQVDVVEDVFGLPVSTYAAEQASGWTEPDFDATAVTIQTAMELPRAYLVDALGAGDVGAMGDTEGYGLTLAVSPQSLSDGYQLWGRISPADYALGASDVEWVTSALLNGAIAGDDTTLTIDASTLSTSAEVGDLVQIGTGSTAELVRITGGNLSTSLTVSRGMLDTTPQEHADNTRLYLVPEPTVPDTTIYVDGDAVDYKLLTHTPSDTLTLGEATPVSLTFDSRAFRAIPPGNIAINGEAWPTLIDGAITVTWAARDRLSHDVDVTQSDTGITTEAGVTYNAYVYDDGDDSLLDSDTAIATTSWSPVLGASATLRIEIESERDGEVSWQRQVRTFVWSNTALILDTDGEYILDTDGDYIAET